jgi:hypothetical protein
MNGSSLGVTAEPGGTVGQRVVYYAPLQGELRLVTVFLTGHWVGAEARLESDQRILKVTTEDAEIILPLPFGE